MIEFNPTHERLLTGFLYITKVKQPGDPSGITSFQSPMIGRCPNLNIRAALSRISGREALNNLHNFTEHWRFELAPRRGPP